ncbi:MAG: hypothetical protein ACYTGG_06115, partial [Planctomycetota bacterium]
RIALGIALGVGHGLATLLRAEHTLLLLLMLVLGGWSIRRDRIPVVEARASPQTGRAVAAMTLLLLVSVVVCLPWSLRGSAAARRFNVTAAPLPSNDAVRPPWTADARAAIEALPAFAREGNFRFITSLAAQAGRPQVARSDVDAFFQDQFDYTPEPITTWAFVSMKGPLDFALANHLQSDGGFSRAALDDGLSPDPPLSFGRPSHLELINRGYAVGLGTIADDPAGWIRLVGRKIARFSDGVTLGLTSMNLPYGPAEIRRPVDLATPAPGARPWWRVAVLGLLVAGLVISARKGQGGVWMLVILYKLVVTILFYGYARQAVSIMPAFAIFMAVPIDAAAGATGRRFLGGRRPRGLVASMCVVVAALVVDGLGSLRGRDLDVRLLTPRGRLVTDDTLAPGALLSNDLLELTPARGPVP